MITDIGKNDSTSRQWALTIGSNSVTFQFSSRRVYTNNCLVHSRVWGHIVGGSKIHTKPAHVVYSLMGSLENIIEILKYLNLFYNYFNYFILYCIKFSN